MSKIMWTKDERDAIVSCAVQYARGRTTTKFQALVLGMKAALTDQSRHRNCVSVTHFGPYISEEFNRRLYETESVGEPLAKIGRTSEGLELPSAKEVDSTGAEPTSASLPTLVQPYHGALPEVLADDEELVLTFPNVVLPAGIVNRIAAFVESRVMTRVMAIMQAAQAQPSQVQIASQEMDALPKEDVLPRVPAQEGVKLQVIVIGFMPQRKQWLLSAIPSRLRNRLDIEFYFENSAITPMRDHIIIHCTMKERSEVPPTLLSHGRYYRSALSPMAVLSNIETAADYHLTKMDQGK